MKKFLAIMIVLTMLFALAIPVLAAGDGPSVGPGGVDSWTPARRWPWRSRVTRYWTSL